MKIILLEDVVGAGKAGDVVEVKNGYARNKLLPAGIALEANKANMRTLEHRRAKIAAKKTSDKEMATLLANKIDGKQVDFIAKAGDAGKLFGSVTSHDIAAVMNETLGFEIDRRKLLLDAPLKEIGLHIVKYRVYPDVEATIKVNIMAEGSVVLPPDTEIADTYTETAEAASEAATVSEDIEARGEETKAAIQEPESEESDSGEKPASEEA